MATSTTTTTRPTLTLLTLPIELRLQIYQHVLYSHYTTLDLPTAAQRPLEHPLIHTTQQIRAESLTIYIRALILHLKHINNLYLAICECYDEQEAEIENFPARLAALVGGAGGSGSSELIRRGAMELDMMVYRLRLLARQRDVVGVMINIEKKRVEVQMQKWREWLAGVWGDREFGVVRGSGGP